MATAKQLIQIAGHVAPPTNDFLLSDAADEVLNGFIWRIQNPTKQVGWKTGMINYDRFTKGMGGLEHGKVVVTGAPSGYGKTHWLIHQALSMVTTPRDDNGRTPRIAFFSLEMSPYLMSTRIMSWYSEVAQETLDPNSIAKMKQAKLWLDEINHDYRLIGVHNIYSMDGIRRKCMQLQQQHGIDLIFIDYVGIVQGSGRFDGQGSYQKVGEVAQQMQELALTLSLPVITATQLNREATKSDTRKGGKEHIADSHQIERVADAIHMMWKPELSKHLVGKNVGEWKNILALETPKVRAGVQPGTMYFHINEALSRYTEVGRDKRKILESEEQQRLIHGIR